MADISQDTIATAGLSPNVGGLVTGDMTRAYQQKDAALKAKGAIQDNVTKLNADKATALAPKMDEMAKAAEAPPPDAPKLEKAPAYEKPTLTPKEVQDNFGLLIAASMLVGATSRAPFYGVMQAMTGALTGYQNRDDQLVKVSMESFDKNMAAIKERNDAARVEFDQAWKKYSGNLPRLKQELEIIGAKYDLPIATENARVASIDSAVKEFDNTIKSGETLLLKLQQQKDKQQADQDKRDETKRHNQELEAAHREAHANRMAAMGGMKPAADGKPAPGVEAATWALLINQVHPFKAMAQGVYQNIESIAADNKMTAQELMSASADVKSRLQAKRTFETRVQNLGRAENQLDLEIPVMQEAMEKLAPIDSPLASKLQISAIRKGIGTQEQRALVTQLDQAAGAVFDEFNGIITGNPGTLNVQDVQNAQEQYHNAQSPTEMRAAIAGMHRIIANAKKANDKTRGEIMGGINDTLTGKKGGDPGSDPSARPSTKDEPESAFAKDASGKFIDPEKERKFRAYQERDAKKSGIIGTITPR